MGFKEGGAHFLEKRSEGCLADAINHASSRCDCFSGTFRVCGVRARSPGECGVSVGGEQGLLSLIRLGGATRAAGAAD